MNYQHSLNIAQPVFHSGFGQNLRRRRVFDLPGGSTLWWGVSKVAVVIVGIALGLNLWLGFTVSRVHEGVQASNERQHLLKDEQIALLAERANLMSERQIHHQAGLKLALYVPEQEQVFKLR